MTRPENGFIFNHDMISEDRLYQDNAASIRSTDDISFKLLGFVPLISGAAIFTFFLKADSVSGYAVVVITLGLFAALITLGLFRWELRNIQTCSWLRSRAKKMEEEISKQLGLPAQPAAPNGIGKTEAAKFIYTITILSWLLMPQLVIRTPISTSIKVTYLMLAGVIAILTLISGFSKKKLF